MNFLLDPNFAYLILLGGIILTLLAVATPGTGALEIGAVFCFLLAGYAVYNLSVHWWAFVILVLSVIPFVYAIKSRNKVFLGLSILLLVIGPAFLFTREDEWMSVNPIIALMSSGLLAVCLWVVGVKFLDTLIAHPMHDLDALIGQHGEARTTIHNDGSAYVNGEQWSARSESKIPKGSHIRVIRREGFTLVVERVE
jgi:membrane-bound serine protease (ClpP class)